MNTIFQKTALRQIEAIAVLILVFLLLPPVVARADDYGQCGDFWYSSDGASITITAYVGFGGDVVISNSIIGLPVKSIGAYSFQGADDSLMSIVIPNGVTNIGEASFRTCTGLTNLVIPDSVISIDDWAFYWCRNLRALTIGSGVKSVGYSAFRACDALLSLELDNGITDIKEAAFGECPYLKSVFIPGGVTNLGVSAFGGCFGLTNVSVDLSNPNYSSLDGVVFNKDQTVLLQYPFGAQGGYSIPGGVTNVGTYAFEGRPSLTSLTIPKSVVAIAIGALSECGSLTNISVASSSLNYSSENGVLFNRDHAVLIQCPGGLRGSYSISTKVAAIGDEAFQGCFHLEEVTIPSSVTNIGDHAFAGCHSLPHLMIPDSVVAIGDGAFFDNTNLTSVVISTNVTSLETEVFGYCYNLTMVTIPTSVTNIGVGAFSWCSKLAELTLPNTVVHIQGSAFFSCTNLGSLVLPTNLVQIDGEAFGCCSSLTNITFPDKIPTIESSLFLGCSSLSKLTIPAGVTSIGSDAFRYCTNLHSLVIPRNVTNIGDYVLYDCVSLGAVVFLGNAPFIGSSVFDNSSVSVIYYYPNATGWGAYFGGIPTVKLDMALSIRTSGPELVLTWPMGVLLETTNIITGPWVTNNVGSPFTVKTDTAVSAKFYRVQYTP